MREDRRKHYDDGFRREALELIKAGAGGNTLARRLAMPRRTAEKWIMLYRSNGEEAVMGGNGSRRYDWETKVAAARDRVENGMTKTEVMAKYAIASIAPLERWCREYRAGGPEALVLLQCLFDRFGSVFPQCGLMVFPVSSSFPGDVRGIGAAACIFPSCQSVLIRPVAAGRRSGRKGTWRYRCPLCKISGDSTGRECRARR